MKVISYHSNQRIKNSLLTIQKISRREVNNMKIQRLWAILLVIILTLSVSLMAACGDDDETAEPTETT